ncbi:MAG: C40 family peptidase [Elusimicrobiota bacterium]
MSTKTKSFTSRIAAVSSLLLCLCLAACAGPGKGLSRSQAGRGSALAKTARGQIGRPYKFGGRSPTKGFDCSGLAWWVHRRHGISIPPTAATQYKKGRKVPKKRLAPGDLLFFTTYRRSPSHVGIYTGLRTFIHAPKTGKGVEETKLDNPYWLKRYLGARRYY